MKKNLVYMIALLALAANFSFAQKKRDNVSTQTDKQNVVVVVPTETLDNKVKLIEGKVVAVYDGDTLSVEAKDGKIYSIWLQGVDAPEIKQDYGKKSKNKLSDLVLDKTVTVVVHKKEVQDRYLGNVYLNGQDINLRQIETGMAWYYKRYGYEQTAEDRKIYAQAEQKARSERAGLWEDKSPLPPWEYRGEAKSPQVTAVKDKENPAAKTNETSDKKYILGPRGGCYYMNGDRKVYVKDKSLCGN